MEIRIALFQLQIAAAVMIVLLLRCAIKKLPKIYSYILWILVFARLMCPISLETDFGIMPSQETGAQWVEQMFSQNSNKDDMVYHTDYTAYSQDHLSGMSGETASAGPDAHDVDAELSAGYNGAYAYYGQNVSGYHGINTFDRLNDEVMPKWSNTFTALLAVWILGIAAIMGYNAFGFIKIRRILQDARLYKENIYVSKAVGVPFTLGVIRPKIYIPDGLKDEEQLYIICHENVHIKRKDYLIKSIAFILTALYWFNPFVWLAFYFLERDMEMSCDERVIKIMGEDIKKQYSQSLLNFAQGKGIAAVTPLTFGENNVSQRIKNVLSYKNAKRLSIVAGIVILAAAGMVLFTNRSNKNAAIANAAGENGNVAENGGNATENAGNATENAGIATKNGDIDASIDEEAEAAAYAPLTEEEHNTPGRALDTWAKGFVDRNGQKLYDLAADKESFMDWDMVYEPEAGVITFGLSSPWPWQYGYDIHQNDDNSAVIRYYMNTSVPEIYVADEEVYTVEKDGLYYIEHQKLKEYYSINSREQFEELYGKDSYDFGYVNTGYSSAFYMFIMQHLMNGTNPEYYEGYTDPVTAAVHLLHLGEGEGSADVDMIPVRVDDMDIPWLNTLSQAGEGSRALVTYTFAEDGSSVEFVMELIEGSQGLWAPVEDGDGKLRQAYRTYRLEPYESGEGDEVYIQTSQYGIYRLDKTGLNCIYPKYLPESTVCAAYEGRLYFPDSTAYYEGDPDYVTDTICVLDIKTGEYDLETFKLGQNASDLFPLTYISIHGGFMDLYGENEGFYSIPLVNTGMTALDGNVWNNKPVSELDEREQNAYGAALREQILRHPDTLFDISNRSYTETYSYLDIDGDGKTEKISLYSAPGHSISYDHSDYILQIGDARRDCWGENLNNYIWAYSPDGSQIILALYEDGPSGDPMTTLYTYDNDRIRYTGSFNDDIRGCSMKNGIISGSERTDVIQTDRIKAEWKIDQNGQLNRISYETYDFLTLNDVTLKIPLPVHSKPDENSESHMLKPQTIRFIRTDSTFSWVYAQGADGDGGWFEMDKMEIKELGKIYMDVFDDLLFYD